MDDFFWEKLDYLDQKTPELVGKTGNTVDLGEDTVAELLLLLYCGGDEEFWWTLGGVLFFVINNILLILLKYLFFYIQIKTQLI